MLYNFFYLMNHKILLKLSMFTFLILGLQSCVWERGSGDMYYMRNTLSEPVMFGVLLKGGAVSDAYDTVVIRPGDCRLVRSEGGIGHISPFWNMEVEQSTGLIYDRYGNAADCVLFFSDSSYVIYSERNYHDYEKHPYNRNCWRIISNDKKTRTIKVEYLIDELDYQNAQQGE